MHASILGTLGLGFVLGMRHSLDGGHLVAVTPIVARERSALRCSSVGLWWGIGHTLSLLIGAVAVLWFRVSIRRAAHGRSSWRSASCW